MLTRLSAPMFIGKGRKIFSSVIIRFFRQPMTVAACSAKVRASDCFLQYSSFVRIFSSR